MNHQSKADIFTKLYQRLFRLSTIVLEMLLTLFILFLIAIKFIFMKSSIALWGNDAIKLLTKNIFKKILNCHLAT